MNIAPTPPNGSAVANVTSSYNVLNLPQVVTLPTGTVTYTYDASGRKLRKVDVISGVTSTTDYVNGIQYSTPTTIAFIQTEEGKAVPGSGTYDYTYTLKDHLGNSRIMFHTGTGSTALLQQVDDYYPFGYEISRTVPSPKNEYLYNNKELQEELVQYDYGSHFYDPVAVHWTTIDPLAEVNRRWSPYNYALNNPIRLTDPDGMKVEDEITNENNISNLFSTDYLSLLGNPNFDKFGNRVYFGFNQDNDDGWTSNNDDKQNYESNDDEKQNYVSDEDDDKLENQAKYPVGFKKFADLVISESSSQHDAAGIASVLINRIITMKTSLYDPDWVDKIGGEGQYNGFTNGIYKKVDHMSIDKIANSKAYGGHISWNSSSL